MSFSLSDRLKNIEKLKSEEFDLIIVGGGITGAGVARDAASRGMRVGLVEAHDFAIGTSSRSSKLVHGGVRYLENLEFGLVFEALAERALLFKLAPHLVHPLRFIIPIYKFSRVGYWKMLAGMWLYDLLALFETPQMHEGLNAAEVKERVKSLDARDLVGAVEYSDAYMDDDRLVIETLRDSHRHGAVIANHVMVVGACKSDGLVKSLSVVDQVTGDKFEIKAKQFVSGVGTWTDIFGEKIDSNWQKLLRPTKGVHLVFSKKAIPVKKAVVMAVESRIIFVIPRHEMVIVGTTDTDFSGDPAEVTTTAEDVRYILNALNRFFPALKVEAKDIRSSYCGVRPLVNDGATTEGKTSREHSIWSHGSNLTFVAGGKYTTYRKISQEVVDHVLKAMSFSESMAFNPSDTKKPLNPELSQGLYERAQLRVKEWSAAFNLDEKLVRRLTQRHGDEAHEILEEIKQKFTLYNNSEAMWMGEAVFAIKHTMCLNLADFYWRRTPLFLGAKDHGFKYLNSISKVFADYYSWSNEEKKWQQDNLMDQMQKELAWRGDF